MRNNLWLAKQLGFLLKKYFKDIKISNPIEIKFGREAKYRFGSIRLYGPKHRTRILNNLFRSGSGTSLALGDRKALGEAPQKSIVTITSMFAKENIPVDIIRYTIAHELCHYAHGFSSANKRLFRYPHHGGIVNKELTERGAGHLAAVFKKWLKNYRKQILSGKVTF